MNFLKIHIRTQWGMYFFAVLFIYLFLLPYQHQLLADKDELTMIRVFDSAQTFLPIFGIWIQYLGFRLLLSKELKELSYSNITGAKSSWCFSNIVVTLFLLLLYAICLAFMTEDYRVNVTVLLFQCIIIGEMTYFFMHLLKSALGGMAFMYGYCFLSIGHLLPEEFCVIRLGLLPVNFGRNRFYTQIFFGVFMVVGGAFLEKIVNKDGE